MPIGGPAAVAGADEYEMRYIAREIKRYTVRKEPEHIPRVKQERAQPGRGCTDNTWDLLSRWRKQLHLPPSLVPALCDLEVLHNESVALLKIDLGFVIMGHPDRG
jgi:hypothetical protein